MLEFLMTMAVITLTFCAATVLVALLTGGVVKLQRLLHRQPVEQRN